MGIPPKANIIRDYSPWRWSILMLLFLGQIDTSSCPLPILPGDSRDLSEALLAFLFHPNAQRRPSQFTLFVFIFVLKRMLMKLELLWNSNLLVGREGSRRSCWPSALMAALLLTDAFLYSLKKNFQRVLLSNNSHATKLFRWL